VLAAGLSEHPRIINGTVVRAPVACTVSVPVRCHIEVGADSRLLHNVTGRAGFASYRARADRRLWRTKDLAGMTVLELAELPVRRAACSLIAACMSGQSGGQGWVRLSSRGVQEGQQVDPPGASSKSAERQMIESITATQPLRRRRSS
jgi:hypothetical protein